MPGGYMDARKILFQLRILPRERCGMNRCKNRMNIRKFRRENCQVVGHALIIA
jgi:hypothetical protein